MNGHPVKTILDVGAVGTVVATLAGWLPSVAALFTIIWTAIRIWESESCRRFVAWVRS